MFCHKVGDIAVAANLMIRELSALGHFLYPKLAQLEVAHWPNSAPAHHSKGRAGVDKNLTPHRDAEFCAHLRKPQGFR